MIWKFDVWDDISVYGNECPRFRRNVENNRKHGGQMTNKAELSRTLGANPRDNEARSSMCAQPSPSSPRKHDEEKKKVEQVVDGVEVAQRRSLEPCEVQLTGALEVGHPVLKAPLFVEKEKCTVSTKERASTGVEHARPSVATQRGAARRKAAIPREPSQMKQYGVPVRTLNEKKEFCEERNDVRELVMKDNKPVFVVILITLLSKLSTKHSYNNKRTAANLNRVNKFRCLCYRIKDFVCTKILLRGFIAPTNNVKYADDCSQCSIRKTSQKKVAVGCSRRETKFSDASQCGRGETCSSRVPGALRPTRTRPLLGLTWCLLLLLSCTGSLVSVRELHDTLNWPQKDLEGPSTSKEPPVGAEAAIIPPTWANLTVNPCALESWQLLYWPLHDKCYKIFSQGPCAVGEEVYHDPHSGGAKCRCEKGRIRHTGRCHVAYTRGPCKLREYLVEAALGEEAQCQPFVSCVTGHVFWPQDGLCYRQFTQGPCQHGDLIHLHPDSGWPTCGCDTSLMRMQFWPHANTCHELLTRGPCVTGHVFTYNRTTRTTECGCGPHLSSNYHRETAQCFPLDTQGPCPDGHTFSLPTGATEPMCTCLSGHLLHVASGTCQRAYTRSVCTSGHFLRPDASAGVGVGRCVPVPCTNTGQLYHPETDSCYPVGTSGPCAKGKLWVYERASSFRGRCHCDDKLVGYWGPHDICYPLGEKGPCPARHVVTYSPTKGLACSCDRRRGYTRWKGRCERITAADIIRDLISRNLMAPAQDRENLLSNSVMHSKARSLREETAARLTTRARFMRTTPGTPATSPTTPQPTHASITEEHTSADRGNSGTGHRVDTHEIITFSRGSANSIEEAASQQQGQRLEEEADISTRIARLTHRGLITRRTRRLPSSSQ